MLRLLLLIATLVFALAGKSDDFRPKVASPFRSDISLESGKGSGPCRWSFSSSYSDVAGASEVNVGQVQVLKCGNESHPATASMPTVPPGPSPPPIQEPTPYVTIPTSSLTMTPTKSPLDTPDPVKSTPAGNFAATTSPQATTTTLIPVTYAPTTSAPVAKGPLTLSPTISLPMIPAPITSAPTIATPVMAFPVIPLTKIPVTQFPTASAADAMTLSPSEYHPRCPCYTENERLQIFTERVYHISDASDLVISNGPQIKALLWLLQEDEAHLCPSDPTGVFIQRYVMATLYFATNGNDWSNCTRSEVSTWTPCPGGASRFLSPASECTWGGCKCDGSGNIVTINIDNNNMRGSIPKELGALGSITELDFGHNSLTGTIPESLGKLSQLLYLDLDENNLTGTIPESIYSLSLLRALDLDTNKLTGTISTKIGLLENVYIAQFDNNHMSGTIPSEAGLLDQLEYLTIVGNNFTGSVPNSLCNSDAKVYANCELCMGEGCCEKCA